MSQPQAASLRNQIQDQIVKILQTRMQAGELAPERASEIAKHVLAMLPENASHEELMKILPRLDDHFVELAEVVVPIMVEYEKKMRRHVDAKIQQLLKAGHFDAAMQIAQKAIEFEKGLS